MPKLSRAFHYTRRTRGEVRAEIDEELASHLDMVSRELERQGLDPSRARTEAERRFGDLASARRRLSRLDRRAENRRRRKEMLGGIRQDVTYALRLVGAQPGFAAVAILSLALGIGATSGIFTVVDGVMLRPLGYPDPHELVLLSERTRRGDTMSIAWPNFRDWRDQNRVFEHLGLYRGTTVTLTEAGPADRVPAAMVSSSLFAAIGLAPLAGRSFTADEDRPGAPRSVVIGERFWRSRLGADPAALQRPLMLDGESHAIVGIMPAGMRFPSRRTDVWLPLGLFADQLPESRGRHPNLWAVGRLKDGVTLDQAVADMDTVAGRLAEQFPESNAGNGVGLESFPEQVVRFIRPALLTLSGAVGFLLLIACVNLANLMLAQADRRQRELALRSALGAGRGRLVRQLLTESLMLAAAGGGLGLLIAALAVKALVASNPSFVPRIDQLGVDLRVVAFTAAVTLLTGLAFGLLPALRATSSDLAGSLKEAARRAWGGGRVRSLLVVAEVALALVMLIGAGLMIRSLSRLLAVETGFVAEQAVTMRVALPQARYPDLLQWKAFHETLAERVAALPGIEAVGVSSTVPLSRSGAESMIVAEGRPLPQRGEQGPSVLFGAVTPGFFEALGVRLVRGRGLTPADRGGAPGVIVIDEMLARALFRDTDPIGKRVAFEVLGDGPGEPIPVWREIVGVVAHVKHYDLASPSPRGQAYTSLAQLPTYFEDRRPEMAIVARTALPAESMVAAIRGEVAAIDPALPVYDVQTLQELVGQQVEQPRLSTVLLAVFASVALVLAVVGIYGVLAYSVARRTREIGVRMALGARTRDVLRLVIGHGMLLTALGILLGVAGALAVTRLLQSQLYGVSPRDPFMFVAGPLLVAAVAFVAAFVPARRGTRVDPVVALRHD
jgi:predicted permease